MAHYSAGGKALFHLRLPRSRPNSLIFWCGRYRQNVVLAPTPVGNFIGLGASRTAFSLVWHVAILGPHRPLWSVGKTDVVRCPTRWFLVGKLPLLFFRASPAGISESKGRGLICFVGFLSQVGSLFLGAWPFLESSQSLLPDFHAPHSCLFCSLPSFLSLSRTVSFGFTAEG